MRALGCRAWYLGAALLGLVSMSAQAGDWTLTNSLSLQSIFSDNINQAANGKAGVLLTASPHVDLKGTGRRVSGNLSYAPSLFADLGGNARSNGINHYLNAAFNSELLRNELFLDTRASAGLITTNTAANYGQDALNYRDNASQVYTFSLSPYAQHRFGSAANLLFRLNGDRVQSDTSGSQLNSTALNGLLQLSSGTRFTRFPWSVSARRQETRYDVRTDQRDSLNASLGYRIDRRWRVDGNIGHQANRIVTSRTESGGMDYSGTVYWTPSPRTDIEAQLGQRYFGTFWKVRGSHQSRRTNLTLDISRDISNARTLALNQDFLNQGIAVIEPLNEDFLSTQVGLNATVSGRRTDVSMGIRWDDRRYEVTPDETQVLSLSLDANRRMTPSLSGNVHMSWQGVQASASDDSQYLDFGVGVSRTLGRYSHVGINLSHGQRTSKTAAEFTENRIGLTLTTRMF